MKIPQFFTPYTTPLRLPALATYRSSMQFKIPQNVQMEDKIVGPLTLKQLIIVGAGGGFAYFIYVSLSKAWVIHVAILGAAPVALLTLAIAFLKIHGLTFIQYVLAAIEFYFTPRQQVWEQGGGEVFLSITSPTPKNTNEKKQEQQQKAPMKDVATLETLAKSLDSYSQMLSHK